MVSDPVTGFTYPDEWVKACRNAESLALISSGLGVLTSNGNVLRRGYTTGTTAAAVCKAAVLSLTYEISTVEVRTPCGLIVTIPVHATHGNASARKDPGDYKADITAELEFLAHASPRSEGIELIPGIGIGHFVRDTPRFLKNEPAISKTARISIEDSIQEAMRITGVNGVTVRLDIPCGAEIGIQTLNPKVGVKGGISVLGSTGLVEPWDDHLSESVFERIEHADRVVLTTGRIGLRFSRMLFPEYEVVLVGVNLKKGIEHAKGEVILCGLPGLILRFIEPQVLEGTAYETVEEFSASKLFSEVVERILKRYKSRKPDVRVVIVNRKGQIVGDSG